MNYQIKGEAGKALDDTLRTLEELNISDAVVSFRSLASDTLVWSAALEDAQTGATIIPEIGQIVELYLDGVRKFRGNVTKPRVGVDQVSIVIEGPWWWMNKINLTNTNTDVTNQQAERVSYELATGAHATKLTAVLQRGVDNGVPMQVGTVDLIYDTPRITLANVSIAQGLTELMSWVADAVALFDYSGTGDPTLNIARRGAMQDLTFTLGTDRVESLDLQPRVDLEVASVDLDYMQRQPTTGLPAFARQSAGTAETGKRQIITVSGPEIADFLPVDDFDSYVATTGPQRQSNYANVMDATIIKNREGAIADMIQISGNPNLGFDIATGNFYGLAFQGSNGIWLSNTPIRHFPPPIVFADVSPLPVFSSGNSLRLINTPKPPDWFIESSGVVTHTTTVSGQIGVFFTNLQDFNNPVFPDWHEQIPWEATIVGGVPGQSTDIISAWSFLSYRFDVEFTYNNIPSPQTFFRPWEYDFISPPAGMAQGMRDAQAWVPWEGSVTTVGDSVDLLNGLNQRINVVGSLPAMASMQSLCKGVSHDIARGRTTYELGAPARLDFGSLVARVRRQPRDNIVQL